jgi:ketosteroid isomerase-like protein
MSDSKAMIIRKVYQDFARGDISAVFAAFDASIAWHVPGHSPLSGDYNGRTLASREASSARQCSASRRWNSMSSKP